MARNIEVSVASSLLKWARESIGKTVLDVAKRFDLNDDMVLKWETGEKNPTLKQLKELAKYYKRPLAVFFLPAPPQEPPLPADFRTLPKTLKKPFSEKTLLVLRRARRLQELAGNLKVSLDQPAEVKIGRASISDNTKTLGMQIRDRLRVSTGEQFKWKSEVEALHSWKKSVEQLGALVLEISFPILEGRAFCLSDEAVPVIVLNSNDAVTGRIFSLFHECGHLLLGQSGICDMSEEHKHVEQFCNRFAGELLVPTDSLLQDPKIRDHPKHLARSDDDLQQLARQYRVSRDVVLLRFLILRLISESFYQRKSREWEIQVRQQKGRRGGRRIPAKQCVRQNGVPFTSLVLESARQEVITHRDVSDYLSISLKYLPAVESIVREEKAQYA
jgi:Zn-dependent peptidase ImmA (M78 family)